MVKNTYHLPDKLATSILLDIAVQLEQHVPTLGVSFLKKTSSTYKYHLLKRNSFDLKDLNIQSEKGLVQIGKYQFTAFQLTQLPQNDQKII
jgi:hypothetical protein